MQNGDLVRVREAVLGEHYAHSEFIQDIIANHGYLWVVMHANNQDQPEEYLNNVTCRSVATGAAKMWLCSELEEAAQGSTTGEANHG